MNQLLSKGPPQGKPSSLFAAIASAVALTLLLSWPLSAGASEDPAGEHEERRDLRGDELRERIPAVTGHLFLKEGRHELTPIGNVSMADAFRRKYMGGLAYSLHLREHFALTARAGYTVLMHGSGTVQVCTRPTECTDPSDDELDTLPGNLALMGGLQAEFSPIYGKINLVAESVLHFDIYVTGGLGLSSYTLRKGGEDVSGLSQAVLVGIGQRYFLNRWMAIRLEILDVMYSQPTGKQDRRMRHEFLLSVGASFFFPTTFTYDLG